MQVRTPLVAAALVLAFFGTVLSVTLGPVLYRLYRLDRHHSKTTGIIVCVDSTNHNRARFTYQVQGAEFEGFEIMSHRKSGERVSVYYLPSEPSVAVLVQPGPALREAVAGAIALGGIALGAAVWVANRIR